ncbi:hypothetical protein QQP08_012531, partial [Theobroma cacao]
MFECKVLPPRNFEECKADKAKPDRAFQRLLDGKDPHVRTSACSRQEELISLSGIIYRMSGDSIRRDPCRKGPQLMIGLSFGLCESVDCRCIYSSEDGFAIN